MSVGGSGRVVAGPLHRRDEYGHAHVGALLQADAGAPGLHVGAGRVDPGDVLQLVVDEQAAAGAVHALDEEHHPCAGLLDTWKDRSLTGEADFHALEYARGPLYGYDSTNDLLRTSKDGATWEDRAHLPALDIAVNPSNPDTVLATTAQGIAKSTDGGKTFTPGTGPVLAYLSWAMPDALYGIDPAGSLDSSTDGGITWKKTATVPGGQPQALTTVDAQRILAATQDGVYESKDGGQTFTRQLAVTHG